MAVRILLKSADARTHEALRALARALTDLERSNTARTRKHARLTTFGALRQIENAIDEAYPLIEKPREVPSYELADMGERMTLAGMVRTLAVRKMWPPDFDLGVASEVATRVLQEKYGTAFVVIPRLSVSPGLIMIEASKSFVHLRAPMRLPAWSLWRNLCIGLAQAAPGGTSTDRGHCRKLARIVQTVRDVLRENGLPTEGAGAMAGFELMLGNATAGEETTTPEAK